jgi:hypothetical protein
MEAASIREAFAPIQSLTEIERRCKCSLEVYSIWSVRELLEA